jgi:hypothetical protein
MKLLDCKVVFICPDHNEKYNKRKIYMEGLLKKIGFKNITHFKSGNERYPWCLTLATINILKENLDEPVLILEDDIGFINNISFQAPLGADAIYLGLSSSAGHATENYNVYYSQFEPYSDSQVRVLNMLATHSILYLSRRYKLAVIEALETCEFTGHYNDITISRIQKNFFVYANKIPTFYQSNLFNVVQNGFDVEKATKLQIMNDMTIVPL